MNSKTDISLKLKTFRRSKCFSQEGLAEAAGVSIRTIQRIEKGLSVGSAFTLGALAKALGIDAKDLMSEESANQQLSNGDKDLLKLMNLSALAVVLIPLSNIFIPAIIFWKNKDNEVIYNYGRRILSFQILWTLLTILLMAVIPMIMLLLVKSLQGGSIPLAVPVYFICVTLNVYVIIRFAITKNGQSNLLQAVPETYCKSIPVIKISQKWHREFGSCPR